MNQDGLQDRTDTRIDTAVLAKSYRRLVICVGVQIVSSILASVSIRKWGNNASAAPLVIVINLVQLATVVLLPLYAYRVARSIGSSVGLLWALAMILPCVNLITLLVLSRIATNACRAAGIQVGILGPK